ncbi:MAG: hypothetical protein H8E70_08175 [Candidatus Marinimicrobia bacterium]|nr:hypothetical protein [Candidatus Neomarinimicrobiota bacterium]
MKKFAFILIPVLMLVSCNQDPEKELVFIDPIQCLGNSWDAAWLETHDYDEYPRTESEQLKIFTDYYEAQGIKMVDVYSALVFDAVCDACSCPTGYRIFCMVKAGDVDFLLDSGFSQH